MSGHSAGLTGTCPFMMTSSAKRTLTGLDLSIAFLAALIKADLGDWVADNQKRDGEKKEREGEKGGGNGGRKRRTDGGKEIKRNINTWSNRFLHISAIIN